MKLAVVLLACVACTSDHPAATTDGTWSVELQLTSPGCGDPEPAEVSFLVQVARPNISTAGLVAPVQTVVDCGGGDFGSGSDSSGSSSSGSGAPNDTEFTPVTTIQAATATHLAFDVDSSTDPGDPMITSYVMDLSDGQLLGTAAYQAEPGCSDGWTLVANRE